MFLWCDAPKAYRATNPIDAAENGDFKPEPVPFFAAGISSLFAEIGIMSRIFLIAYLLVMYVYIQIRQSLFSTD
ncbi:hypothetical protein L1987_16729 [Smallanthus sonchifolius]|uniref:Uncharacterized protein n=1 Tax=Smallanthus sonchifolius TaxID=185202 RepID=A0ACB9IX14_9ASTR|nr:hypothetical protein L1987_16729 [Smallanthus sonchifolius]